jgi:DNA repair exonuclease SbcCD nuclease subunit
MIKVLLVGDMHVVPEELQDCQKVIDAIRDTVVWGIKNSKIDTAVFMGDQHHTHAVVRLEVLSFWREALLELGKLCKVVLLKGNHDAPADINSRIHVLEAYEGLPNVVVIDKATTIDGIDFVPYMPAQAFVETVKDLKAPTLICHQTFQGAQYENGFFAHDGIELSLTPHKHVFSGHIHTPQSWDKLIYVGSPRWRTVSDANVNRFFTINYFYRWCTGRY